MADRDDLLSAAERTELAGLLTAWLPEQRWFAGKGHALTGVTITDVTALPTTVDPPPFEGVERVLTTAVESTLARIIDLRGLPQALHLIVGVCLDGTGWQTYQVPVCLYEGIDPGDRVVVGELSDGRVVVDALTDPVAMTSLLLTTSDVPVLDPAETHGRAPDPGTTTAPTFEAVRADPAWDRIPPRGLGVEQSNTSIVVGGTALAKMFRRLAPGTNPDIEVHAALHGNPHLVSCLGWVNGGWHDPGSQRWLAGHFAMVQALVSPGVDGFALACARVSAGESFSAEARTLGVATAVVHADLRVVFGTRRLSGSEVEPVVRRLLTRLDAAAQLVAEVAELHAGLAARIEAVGQLTGDLEVQRVHGDYHLGQVLLAPDGWKLLDFEGEPGAEIAARTAADHALRDVAGMLRSFAYAGASGGAQRPADEVAAWHWDCERAFLAGYGAGAVGSGIDAGQGPGQVSGEGPELSADGRAILEAYLVDKAVYEAVYEKRHRPDWLGIPLTFLKGLAGR